MLPTKFCVNLSNHLGVEVPNTLKNGGGGGHVGFPMGTISAIFDLQVTQIVPIKF